MPLEQRLMLHRMIQEATPGIGVFIGEYLFGETRLTFPVWGGSVLFVNIHETPRQVNPAAPCAAELKCNLF
jgi:hypothetical protein